jgi:hypothetical protein
MMCIIMGFVHKLPSARRSDDSFDRFAYCMLLIYHFILLCSLAEIVLEAGVIEYFSYFSCCMMFNLQVQ